MEIQNRFIGIDGLRALFCTGLVFYHINEVFHSAFYALLWPVYQYGGYFGNYIFFMVSGFLVAFFYKERVIDQTITFSQYISKRICKWLPMYLLTNVMMMLYLCFKDRAQLFDIKKFLTTALILPSGWFSQDTPYNQPLWFVSVLMICYILYYVIGKLSHRFSAVYMPLCIFLVFWGMILEVKAWNIPFHYRICGEGYMNFFLGVILAEIIRNPKVTRKYVLTFHIVSLGLIAAVVFVFKMLPVDMRWIITLICSNLIGIAVYEKHIVKLLSLRIIQRIGQCGLSVYMWHVPLARWFRYIESSFNLSFIDDRINMIIYLVLLFGVAQVSYRWLESVPGKGSAGIRDI
ncbi:acyltransferase [bacterium 1XD8-76]|nr:acyltransferase [bacterium 1XD8-76]